MPSFRSAQVYSWVINSLDDFVGNDFISSITPKVKRRQVPRTVQLCRINREKKLLPSPSGPPLLAKELLGVDCLGDGREEAGHYNHATPQKLFATTSSFRLHPFQRDPIDSAGLFRFYKYGAGARYRRFGE